MGFRFRKSINAGPLRVNFSKSGVGYSVGGKGFRYTKKAGGGTRTTASIPGTGISYTKETGKKKRGNNMSQHQNNTQNRNNAPQGNTDFFTKTFRPVNISKENVKKLARLNSKWKLDDSEILATYKPGQKIHQLTFVSSPVQLLPESDDSIAVIVAGQKIGYVGTDINAQISEILESCNIQQISCSITGGQCKIVNDDYTISTQNAYISIIVGIKYTRPQAIRHRQKDSANAGSSSSSKTEWLLCLFLGWLGVHKFYKKKIGIGILYLLTFGLFFVGWWGDAILLTLQRFGKADGSHLSKTHKFAAYALAFVFALVLGSCGGNEAVEPSAISTEPSAPTIATTEATEYSQAETSVERPTDPPSTKAPTEASPEEYTYILNTNTKKFHYSWCHGVDDMKSSNKDEYTGTRDEVIGLGYKPCGNCDP